MSKDEAKERVEQELEELNDRIAKLSMFLFGGKAIAGNISGEMRYQMKRQLMAMQEYAEALQTRLRIWGKTDDELNNNLGKLGQ